MTAYQFQTSFRLAAAIESVTEMLACMKLMVYRGKKKKQQNTRRALICNTLMRKDAVSLLLRPPTGVCGRLETALDHTGAYTRLSESRPEQLEDEAELTWALPCQETWWAPPRLYWGGGWEAPRKSSGNTPGIRGESGPPLWVPAGEEEEDDERLEVKPPPLSGCSVSRSTGPNALTLSEEQAVTLEAAMMKSRINIVAPGRPMLKNLGLQCFMMVFTMSCKHGWARVSATSSRLDSLARGCQHWPVDQNMPAATLYLAREVVQSHC